MKRIYMWLRELSLTQQLITIVILVVCVFGLFFSVFLSPSIESFSDTEMKRILHYSHENAIYYLQIDPEIIPYSSKNDENGIIQGLYDTASDQYIMYGGKSFTEEEKAEFQTHLAEANAMTSDYQMQKKSGFGSGKSKILYSMTRLDDGMILISLLPASFEEQFKLLLLNNIVNVNVIVVTMLFLLLLLWVASMIHPLNQIKAYVKKLKNEEPATLNIDRRDEIGEVADALVEMQDELAKQNQEKEEMIQNISHDLKTPIATIRSYSESIKDGVYPYGTLEKSIDVIIEHADRLDKKVRSLIALNKMGYLLDDCPEGDTLNMNNVIDKVLLSLKVIRPEISFERVMDTDVRFHGDEDPWRIVVENLIDNSLRYARSTIQINLHDNELIISNDGVQIDPGTLDKMFRPYEKGTDGQFGLGLSIVYKVVTTYGYKVEAANLPNGVQFRIWKEVSRREKKAREKERAKGNRKHQEQA